MRLSPSNVALSQGGNQLLECIVTNPRGGSIGGTISWRRENSTTLDQHKGRYLQMNAVTSADTDIYCCSVDAGNGEMIEDCTIVTVGKGEMTRLPTARPARIATHIENA